MKRLELIWLLWRTAWFAVEVFDSEIVGCLYWVVEWVEMRRVKA